MATQQTRASVLSYAAHQEFGDEKKNIAVIGAGFAGLSCVATLLQLGHKVTLFEKKDRFVPLQIRCYDRFLHPDLYDWPNESGSDTFSLAGITWQANFANEVAQQTINSLDAITKKAGKDYEPRMGICIEHVDTDKNDKYILRSAREFTFPGFDIVFFAVGFGEETPSKIGDRIRKYWHISSLDHIHGTEANPVDVLISGAGDGGLVSVLNCALKDYDQSHLHKLAPEIFTQETKDQIKAIEEEISSSRGKEKPSIIGLYDEHFLSKVKNWKLVFEPLITKETIVTFNSRTAGVFTPGSAALNRLLVYILMRSDLIKFIGFDLIEHNVSEKTEGGNLVHEVKWGDGRTSKYHHIIVRHGVAGDFFEKSFKDLSENVADMRKFVPELELEGAIPQDILDTLNSLEFPPKKAK